MRDPEEFKTHADLLDRMAAHLGVDLEEAAIAGDLSIDGLTDAMLRCVECSAPDGCRIWLDRRENGELSDRTPGFCRNRSLLHSLAASR